LGSYRGPSTFPFRFSNVDFIMQVTYRHSQKVDPFYMGNYGDLRQRTKHLALRIIRLYRALQSCEEGRVLGKQLIRSGTSIGANYRAACRARSKAEFIAKLGIVLEESDESAFWLELLRDSDLVAPEKVGPLLEEVDQLTSIFVSSICTAKGVQK
jgi:four helix bundle protein